MAFQAGAPRGLVAAAQRQRALSGVEQSGRVGRYSGGDEDQERGAFEVRLRRRRAPRNKGKESKTIAGSTTRAESARLSGKTISPASGAKASMYTRALIFVARRGVGDIAAA
ncbi:hypothetical protein [Micromonospora sp. NPDC049301]|uniref:hypothetical protein n=1 Tax=Micromonospora sp. NPDC049301 TaxID=3155723 RepID=UPI0034326F7F